MNTHLNPKFRQVVFRCSPHDFIRVQWKATQANESLAAYLRKLIARDLEGDVFPWEPKKIPGSACALLHEEC